MGIIAATEGKSAAPATADAFRLWLSEALVADLDPARVLAIAAEGLGRFLCVTRVGYGESEPGQDHLTVPLDWSSDSVSMAGRRRFPRDSATARHYRAGKTLVVSDTALAGDLTELEAPDTRAFVGVPLLHQREFVGLFTVVDRTPRQWSEEEIALVAHTGGRIQGALDHVRAIARLRESGEQFRTLAENMPGICWLADATGVRFWMNARGLAFHGQLDGPTLGHVHTDDASAATAWLQALALGNRLEITARVQAADGGWCPLLHRVEPVRDGSGAVTRWCGVQLDLSDQHRRDRHDAFFRALGDAIRSETDPACVMTVAGDMLEAQLGAARVAYDEDVAAASPPVTGELRVTLMKEGRLVAVLAVRADGPRDWNVEEQALVEEVAERIWSAVTRARAEAALRERERVQAFLIGWSDAVRRERGTRAILATTLDRLGRYLDVTRLNYAEVDGDGEALSVLQQWGSGDNIIGRPFLFAALGRRVIADHLTGRPLVVVDVEDHPLFGPDNLPIYRATGVAALVSVPLVREGALRAVLCAQQDTLRQWSEMEVQLIHEVAERTWAILERARFEERLTESEALLAAFMDHAPVGMHLKDGEGRYLRINAELAIAIDLPDTDVIGHHPRDLFPAEVAERVATLEEQALAGATVTAEFTARPRDRYAAMLAITFPVPGDHRVRTGGFTLDLSGRKQAEAALRQSREALYQSEKLSALGSMLAGVSHELNNPLSIVVAQAVMMERQAKGTELAERAFRIRKAADRCARIVQTFLAMARQKAPTRTAIDLGAVADAAIELASYGLRADGIVVTRRLDPALPAIAADADQLHQIVTNLLVNAQQALASVDGPRWIEVRTALGDEANTVVLEVADGGPGIPPETGRRIFEPFFTTKPQGEGTGMGLSFSQGLAEAHGGRLELVPTDHGAHFRLVLPVDGGDPVPTLDRAPDLAVSATPRRALIVDDEEEIAGALADFLSIEGYVCDVVIGGLAARQRLAGGAVFDLVVTDLRMPGLDGPGLFAWIAAERPELVPRTAFTTGDTLGNAAARFLAEAGRPVLEKPFMPDTIRRFLAEVGE